MSGCTGNQAVAVSRRELSLGLLRPTELYQVMRKALGVGAINGIVLGILIEIGNRRSGEKFNDLRRAERGG